MTVEEKNLYQKELFTNRLKKKYRELKKYARKNRISSYRLYDRDIPEIPLSLDIYEFLPEEISDKIECARYLNDINSRISANDPYVEKELEKNRYAVLYLYERPYEKLEEEEEIWLSLMQDAACDVLGIEKAHVIKKMRKMQKGQNQYEKAEGTKITGLTQEQGELFKIDLSSYLDTGLFFDHRVLRKNIRDLSRGKRVLNLFCYTGSFSVYAAEGGAKYVESVDLSNTYLSWAKENMNLNGFSDEEKFVFTKADVIFWLETEAKNMRENKPLPENKGKSEAKKPFDIIILDPPTFSNSKSTQNVLDINRDYIKLIKDCLSLLSEKGVLYFSTNSKTLQFEKEKLPAGVQVQDVTGESIPKDFEGTKCHRLWKIQKTAMAERF